MSVQRKYDRNPYWYRETVVVVTTCYLLRLLLLLLLVVAPHRKSVCVIIIHIYRLCISFKCALVQFCLWPGLFDWRHPPIDSTPNTIHRHSTTYLHLYDVDLNECIISKIQSMKISEQKSLSVSGGGLLYSHCCRHPFFYFCSVCFDLCSVAGAVCCVLLAGARYCQQIERIYEMWNNDMRQSEGARVALVDSTYSVCG